MFGKRTSLQCMSLKDFIFMYRQEMDNYYPEDFDVDYIKPTETIQLDNWKTHILCLVDTRDILFSSPKKPTLRRGGVKRRRKIKHRYSYENPMNRIHGYLVVEKADNSLTPENKKLLSLSLVCSSIFSDKRGIGSDLMDILLDFSKEQGFTDVVLEVANEYSGIGQESEEEESEEEESEEEESEEEEWVPEEDALEVLSHELWRKTMRKVDGNVPYYNVEKGYIYDTLYDYFYCDDFEPEEKKPNHVNQGNPADKQYGGFWFQKGYQSQLGLIQFYEKFGFHDEPSVNLDWNCFTCIPFPTMICSI